MKKLILLAMVLMAFASIYAVLLNESFTGTTFPPADWSAPATAWQRYTSYYNTTPACAKSGYSSGTWWLVTPKLRPAAGANTLTFWYRDYDSSTGWDYVDEYTYVMVSTTTDFTGATTLWTGTYTTFTTTWQQASIPLSGYNGTDIYIAFKSIHTGGNYRMIDDVTGVDLAPAGLPNPAALVSPTPTGVSGVLPTATLNWANGGGGTTGYKLYYGTTNGDTTPPWNILSNSEMSTAVTYDPPGLLTWGQHYYWKIVPYNGAGSAINCPVWEFTVMPDPTISSFPYTENFDSVTAPALPAGWTVSEGVAGSSYHWATTTTAAHGAAAPVSTPNYAWLYCYLASTSYNDYSLITPPISLPAVPKRLLYSYWIGDDSYTNPLFVDISTDLTTWTNLYTHDNTTNTLAWYQNAITLTSYASSVVYLRFRGVSNYGNYMCDFGIDNVLIGDLPAGAPDPVTLNYPGNGLTGLPNTGFNLTWTNAGTGGTPTYYGVYMSR
jgi:hypothetical protein